MGISREEAEQLGSELTASHVPMTAKSSLRVHPKDGFLLFEFEDGLSFYRAKEGETPSETFRSYVKDPIVLRYLPVTYEIDSDDAVSNKILDQFQEKYGKKARDRIDSMVMPWNGRTILMCLIPQEIVSLMMREHGGMLATYIRGPAHALRSIPAMNPLVSETTAGDEYIRRVFATPYQKGQYEEAYQIHMKLLEEVMKSEASGISVGPIGSWSP